MARSRYLLMMMFVLTLFMMCCSCESGHHDRDYEQRRPDWDHNGWNRGGIERDRDGDRDRGPDLQREEREERR
jgi:hypothetical protein